MKLLSAIMVLALLLTASPVWAATAAQDMASYPDTADSIKQPRRHANFNTRPSSTRQKASDGVFPQGKNSHKPQKERVISSRAKPEKPVCIGEDCGCTSGKNR